MLLVVDLLQEFASGTALALYNKSICKQGTTEAVQLAAIVAQPCEITLEEYLLYIEQLYII